MSKDSLIVRLHLGEIRVKYPEIYLPNATHKSFGAATSGKKT